MRTFESPLSLWIVEEWCQGGELTDHLAGHRYTEQAVAVQAVAVVHHQSQYCRQPIRQ